MGPVRLRGAKLNRLVLYIAFTIAFIRIVLQLDSLSSRRHASPGLRVYLDRGDNVLACAIASACITTEREYMLLHVSTKLRPYSQTLSNCIHRRAKLLFYEESSAPPPLARALARQLPFDLLGRHFADGFAEHMPHFSSAFLRFASVPAAVFLARRPPPAHCLLGNGTGLSRCQSSVDPPLIPAFAIGRRVLNAAAARWVLPFLQLILRGMRTGKSVIKVVPDADANHPLCFRNILTSPREHSSGSVLEDEPYRGAGVRRRLSLEQGKKCAPRVTIITRDPQRMYAGVTGARAIPDSLLRQLVDSIGYKATSAGMAGIPRKVRVVTELGKEGFEGQVRAMQRTDILVSVHGAELGNCVFLRQGAIVIELFPFAYHMPNFQGLMKQFKVRHVPVYGSPDVKSFQTCVDNEMKANPKSNVQETRRLVKEFEERAEMFVLAEGDVERDSASDYCHEGWSRAAQLMRKCTRSQHVVIDPQRLATIIVHQARRMCRS